MLPTIKQRLIVPHPSDFELPQPYLPKGAWANTKGLGCAARAKLQHKTASAVANPPGQRPPRLLNRKLCVRDDRLLRALRPSLPKLQGQAMHTCATTAAPALGSVQSC